MFARTLLEFSGPLDVDPPPLPSPFRITNPRQIIFVAGSISWVYSPSVPANDLPALPTFLGVGIDVYLDQLTDGKVTAGSSPDATLSLTRAEIDVHTTLVPTIIQRNLAIGDHHLTVRPSGVPDGDIRQSGAVNVTLFEYSELEAAHMKITPIMTEAYLNLNQGREARPFRVAHRNQALFVAASAKGDIQGDLGVRAVISDRANGPQLVDPAPVVRLARVEAGRYVTLVPAIFPLTPGLLPERNYYLTLENETGQSGDCYFSVTLFDFD